MRAARELRESERQTYRAAIAAAAGTIDSPFTSEPLRHLESAPVHLRGWEWRYYAARVAPAYREVGSSGYNSAGAAGLVSDRLAACYEDQDGLSLRLFSASTGEEFWHRPLVEIEPLRSAFRAQDTELVVLARSEDGAMEAHVFDAQSGEALSRRELLDPRSTTLAISAHGRRCALLSSGTLFVIDVATGEQVGQFAASYEEWAPCFGLDGRLLAYRGRTGAERVVDLDSGEELDLGRFYLSPRSSLAVGFGEQTIEVRDLLDPAFTTVSFPDNKLIHAALLSPDGRFLALSNQSRLEMLEVGTGKKVGPRGTFENAWQLAFLPNGKEFAYFGEPRCRIFPVVATASVFTGHTSYVYAGSFSPDGRAVASGAWDSTVRVWDRTTFEELWRWDAPMEIFALDWLDRDLIVNAGHDVIRLDPEQRVIWRHEGDEEQRSIEVNAEGTRVLVTTYYGALCILDAATGEVVLEADLNVKDRSSAYGAERTAAWSPTGDVLAAVAVSAAGSRVELRAADDLRVLRSLGDGSNAINQLSFSPDGRLLAASSLDAWVRVFDVETGALVCPPLQHEAEVLAAAFSPDGTRLATGGRDRIVHIFETERFEELVQLHGHEAYIYRLEWSPDGEALVSSSGDATVRIWDAAGAPSESTRE